jgi:fatty-acyl-CoA synthase
VSDRHFRFWPDRSRQHLDAPATNVFHNLEVSARRYPAKPGLIYYDTPTGFAEIHDEAGVAAERGGSA